MKVIFTDRVEGVAARGDVKNVKNGFFRNFLLPRNKAVMATASALKDWESRREKILIERKELMSKLEEIKRRLSDVALTIEKKITAKGTLYGGVKAAEVAKAITEQFKIDIPENAIELPANIKSVGTYEVAINLGEGMKSSVKLTVSEKK